MKREKRKKGTVTTKTTTRKAKAWMPLHCNKRNTLSLSRRQTTWTTAHETCRKIHSVSMAVIIIPSQRLSLEKVLLEAENFGDSLLHHR